MKITDVKVTILAERTPLVQVFTDADIVGISEASPKWIPATRAMIEEVLKPLIVGEDPSDIERLWHKMFYGAYKAGSIGVHVYGISSIDIALYDLMGKALNVPVYKLLGGAYRRNVRMYASFFERDLTTDQVVQRAFELVKLGYTAIKFSIGNSWGFDSKPKRSDIATVKAVREAVGDKIELLVDASNAYTPHTAIRIGRALEEYGVFHFEEPIHASDWQGLKEVSTALDLPIAAGESHSTRFSLKELISNRAVDIIQPDPLTSGGYTECRKIAAMAEVWEMPCTLHQSCPTLSTVINLHFAAATPNCLYAQEYVVEPHPLRDALLTAPVQPKDGYLTVPEGAGLGVELNEEVIKGQIL